MRLLWARVGRPHCPSAASPSPSRPRSRSWTSCSNSRTAPVSRSWLPWSAGRKGEFVDLFKRTDRQGLLEGPGGRRTVQLSEPPKLGKQFKHTIEVVVDRLVVKEGISQRLLTDSVETALGLAEGRDPGRFVDLEADDPGGSGRSPSTSRAPTSTRWPSTRSSRGPSPSTTRSAPAAPVAASAPKLEVDEELIIPNPELSLSEGAIAPWSLGTATTNTGTGCWADSPRNWASP